MVKVSKKTSEKYVKESTFEKSMRSIANSFEKVFSKFDNQNKILELVLKEVKNSREENKESRKSISNLNIDSVSYERRIEDLTFRVEKLESRNK
jgi:septal ring factor EnvC (AmiA/AmiB activator)